MYRFTDGKPETRIVDHVVIEQRLMPNDALFHGPNPDASSNGQLGHAAMIVWQDAVHDAQCPGPQSAGERRGCSGGAKHPRRSSGCVADLQDIYPSDTGCSMVPCTSVLAVQDSGTRYIVSASVKSARGGIRFAPTVDR